MYIFLTILIIITSILLAFSVLIQNSKGGGLAAGFSAPQQIMGVRKTTDFLEKFTWGLGAGLLIMCIVANFVLPGGSGSQQQKASSIQEQIDNATLPASQTAPLPGATDAQQAQPAKEQPAN